MVMVRGHAVRLVSPGRPVAPRGPRAAARAPAHGGRARRAPRTEPARHVQAPARPTRGGPRQREDRGPAPRLRAGARAAGRARRLADAVPASVDAQPRRPRASSRLEGGLMHGTYETIDGKPAVRFERRLAHPIERVWRSITEPDELEAWFPSQVSGELRLGATLRFSFEGGMEMEGEVTEFDPPHRLAFSWGEDLLRFELEPDGEGTLLRLTDVLTEPDRAARDAAGWHVCLDRLEQSLGGEDVKAPGSEPTGEWRERYEEYERRGLPTGAEIPS